MIAAVVSEPAALCLGTSGEAADQEIHTCSSNWMTASMVYMFMPVCRVEFHKAPLGIGVF